ncbi:MAG: 16S rRNA (adenine(1518)-N(6)/adenine(1519)-N(6))-dimethyltransferase RsmA [Eubacteriales bacterium]|nr:16S rRNA (adenine(1518)-N(6)/adenine(1519)-N(6))-dimethyltransferase RsmA [Eubacteriales bacterium]
MMNERELVKGFLSEYQITAKRSLGQNFLCSEEFLLKIVQDLPDTATEAFELGAGLGSLTNQLVNQFSTLTAVEIDQRLLPILAERFRNTEKVRIIEGDILTYPWLDLDINNPNTVLFANLPYYITQPALERIVLELGSIPELRFVLQKEAVERIMAPPRTKAYGPLNVLLDLVYETKQLCVIPGQAFYPPPKVRSSLIRLRLKSPHPLRESSRRKAFMDLLKLVFNQRRKQLNSSFKLLSLSEENLAPELWALRAKRAEDLSPKEYLELFEALEELQIL